MIRMTFGFKHLHSFQQDHLQVTGAIKNDAPCRKIAYVDQYDHKVLEMHPQFGTTNRD
jgi:hypothetical protein